MDKEKLYNDIEEIIDSNINPSLSLLYNNYKTQSIYYDIDGAITDIKNEIFDLIKEL